MGGRTVDIGGFGDRGRCLAQYPILEEKHDVRDKLSDGAEQSNRLQRIDKNWSLAPADRLRFWAVATVLMVWILL